MNAPKEKFALCIPTEQVHEPMDTWQTKLVSRNICETDKSTLQIIPYIVMIDIDKRDVFMYTRGKAGDENRLHAKKSIGIGGHMDNEVTGDIYDALKTEATREILEETGYVCQEHSMTILGKVIYLPLSDNPVDHVHVGVTIVVNVKKEELVKLEEGVILEPTWISLTDLKKLADETDQLEYWSKEAVNKLTNWSVAWSQLLEQL